MKSDKCLLAKSNLPGVNKARSEDSCLLFEDGAALVDGVSASDCESGSLMSKATVLNLGRTWLERQDVGELMAITDEVVSGIENAASIRKGGAAACSDGRRARQARQRAAKPPPPRALRSQASRRPRARRRRRSISVLLTCMTSLDRADKGYHTNLSEKKT